MNFPINSFTENFNILNNYITSLTPDDIKSQIDYDNSINKFIFSTSGTAILNSLNHENFNFILSLRIKIENHLLIKINSGKSTNFEKQNNDLFYFSNQNANNSNNGVNSNKEGFSFFNSQSNFENIFSVDFIKIKIFEK